MIARASRISPVAHALDDRAQRHDRADADRHADEEEQQPPPRRPQLAREHPQHERHDAASAADAWWCARPARRAARSADVGHRGQLRIVRDEHDRRLAGAVDVEQQIDDRVPGRAVEVAGRLVGQQDRRVVGERARDRHALLLAARELRRIVMARGRAARPRPAGVVARAAGVRHAGNLHRHEHVLERGQRRQQVEELEDEPDARAAQPGQRVLVERRDVDAVEDRCCPVEGASSPASSPSSVDLPLPGRAGDRDDTPAVDARDPADAGS